MPMIEYKGGDYRQYLKDITIVIFYTPKCESCKKMKPDLFKIAEGSTNLLLINSVEFRDEAIKEGFKTSPTIRIYHGDDMKKEFIGYTKTEEITKLLG